MDFSARMCAPVNLLLLSARCAAPDFSGAQLVPAARSTPESPASAAGVAVKGAAYHYSNVTYHVPPDQRTVMCSGRMADEVIWLARTSDSAPAPSGGARGSGRSCPAEPGDGVQQAGLFCASYGNPNSGMTSFDHILWAWVAIFQVVTMVRKKQSE
jgi:hypothetical protein